MKEWTNLDYRVTNGESIDENLQLRMPDLEF
jgi:hypothetical protein